MKRNHIIFLIVFSIICFSASIIVNKEIKEEKMWEYIMPVPVADSGEDMGIKSHSEIEKATYLAQNNLVYCSMSDVYENPEPFIGYNLNVTFFYSEDFDEILGYTKCDDVACRYYLASENPLKNEFELVLTDLIQPNDDFGIYNAKDGEYCYTYIEFLGIDENKERQPIKFRYCFNDYFEDYLKANNYM